MRSSKPSPLISPALLTEVPKRLLRLAIPLRRKPLLPSREDSYKEVEKGVDLPKTT